MKTETKTTKRRPRRFNVKRPCPLCARGILHVDYKDVELLNNYVGHNGRILARRITGLCAKHQRMVTVAIKRARIAALMAFVKE